MSNTHWLKVWPEFYDDVASGIKPFEVRVDDRLPRYEVGDTFILAEWDNVDGKYTGRDCEKQATYILRGERFCKKGFCVIGLTESPSDLILPVRCGECEGCAHKGTRHQKCACCKRNVSLKDCYTTKPET